MDLFFESISLLKLKFDTLCRETLRFTVQRKEFVIFLLSATSVPYVSCSKNFVSFVQGLTPCLLFVPSTYATAKKPLLPKESLCSAADSHPVAFLQLTTGEHIFKSWFPSCLPCPTPVCSAPPSWHATEGAQLLYVLITRLCHRLSRLTQWTPRMCLRWKASSAQSCWIWDLAPLPVCVLLL